MIKLLLVDDEERIRQGWRMRLSLEPDMIIVGETADGETAIRLAQDQQPDLALMDMHLAGQDGLTTAQMLHAQLPTCQVIMVTIDDTPTNREAAKAAGIVAFIAKQELPEVLVTAIRAVINRHCNNKQGD